MCAWAADVMQPLKLSLCGGTALTHDAVSALLRLPILTELDIGGCCRIIAMDKMRLVAKVCVLVLVRLFLLLRIPPPLPGQRNDEDGFHIAFAFGSKVCMLGLTWCPQQRHRVS